MIPISTITVISYRSRNKCKTFPFMIGSMKVPTLLGLIFVIFQIFNKNPIFDTCLITKI